MDGHRKQLRVDSLRNTPYILGKIRTEAVRHALNGMNDVTVIADLLFLEAWEIGPVASVAATLRAAQIRRANPELADKIRVEAQRIRAHTSQHAAALDAAAVHFPSIHEDHGLEPREQIAGA